MFQENVFLKKSKVGVCEKGIFYSGEKINTGGASSRKSQSLLKLKFSTVCIIASWTIFITRLSFALFLGVYTFCSVPQKKEIGFLEGVLCV